MIELKTLWEREKLLVTSNSPFPTMFSKTLCYRCIKMRTCIYGVKG